MSGARASVQRLRDAGERLAMARPDPIEVYSAGLDVLMASDLDAALSAALRLAVVAESEATRLGADIATMQAEAKRLAQIAEGARAAVLAEMEETGAPDVRSEHHIATVTRGRPAVVITDAAALPAAMLRQPPPEPDKRAIAEALRRGPVPGATLSNAPSYLTIRTKAPTR